MVREGVQGEVLAAIVVLNVGTIVGEVLGALAALGALPTPSVVHAADEAHGVVPPSRRHRRARPLGQIRRSTPIFRW